MKDLVYKLHTHSLNLRNCTRFIDTDSFKRAWGAATDAQQLLLTEKLLSGNKASVMLLTAKILSDADIEKSANELRELARQRGIKNYGKLTKIELQTELEKDKNARASEAAPRRDATPPGASGNQGCPRNA